MQTLPATNLNFATSPTTKSSTCQYGRLALQPKPKTTKGDAFQIDDLLYVDDGTFLFSTLTEMKEALQTIHDHFAKFRLQMHVGSTNAKSKTEAMFFPSSLTHTKSQKTLPKNFDLNNGNNHAQFTDKFKYLGSIVTPCLTENAEINARIKRAKSQTGILRHFFSCMDIKLRAKYWVYIAGCLNILLWGQNPGIFLIRTKSNYALSITLHSAESWVYGQTKSLNAK